MLNLQSIISNGPTKASIIEPVVCFPDNVNTLTTLITLSLGQSSDIRWFILQEEIHFFNYFCSSSCYWESKVKRFQMSDLHPGNDQRTAAIFLWALFNQSKVQRDFHWPVRLILSIPQPTLAFSSSSRDRFDTPKHTQNQRKLRLARW